MSRAALRVAVPTEQPPEKKSKDKRAKWQPTYALLEVRLVDAETAGRLLGGISAAMVDKLRLHGMPTEGARCAPEDDRPEATEKLFDDLYEWTCRYIGLTDEFRVAFVAWCMGTWVYETFASYPYIRLFGPPGSGKSTTEDVAVALCGKPKTNLAD